MVFKLTSFLILPVVLLGQNAALPQPPAPDTFTVAPLTVNQKFHYRVVQAFGVRGLVVPLFSAAIEQARNVPGEWGGGMEGYGKRYANIFGTTLSRHTIEFGLESVLHEDPRYFPSASHSTGSRIGHALAMSVVTRTDSGSERPAFSRIASALAAGQLANTWQPATNSSVEDGLIRGVLTLAEQGGFNLLQEFFPKLRPRSMRP